MCHVCHSQGKHALSHPLTCIYFERGQEGEGQNPMLTFGKRMALTKISLYYSLKKFYGAPITETEHLQAPEHT